MNRNATENVPLPEPVEALGSVGRGEAFILSLSHDSDLAPNHRK